MTLNEYIEFLENKNPKRRLVMGLGSPHSYRGYYEQLAFEFKPSQLAGDMLNQAKACLGAEFHGYKGGTFRMSGGTELWIALYGDCGSELTRGLLDALFAYSEEAP